MCVVWLVLLLLCVGVFVVLFICSVVWLCTLMFYLVDAPVYDLMFFFDYVEYVVYVVYVLVFFAYGCCLRCLCCALVFLFFFCSLV